MWDADRLVQRIAYGKGKSDTVAKLDGTFKLPASAAPGPSTELQQSIFSAAPSAAAAAAAAKGPASDVAMADGDGPHGQKRARENDEGSDEDAAMEEDEDDAMEESDDD